MCSISGYIVPNNTQIPKAKEIITNLLIEGMVRGEDATGLGCVIPATASVHKAVGIKQALPADKFVDTDDYHNFLRSIQPKIVIGHTRAKTKGTEEIADNNHPVTASGMLLVHNGMISNDDALFEEYALRRTGEVDSEIIVKLISYFKYRQELSTMDAISATYSRLQGSAAIALVDKHEPGVLYLAASTSPCVMAYERSTGSMYFASTKSILQNALEESHKILGFFTDRTRGDDYIYQDVKNNTALRITPEGIAERPIQRPAYTQTYGYYPKKTQFTGYTPITNPAAHTTSEIQERIDYLEECKVNNSSFPGDYKELKKLRKTLKARANIYVDRQKLLN